MHESEKCEILSGWFILIIQILIYILSGIPFGKELNNKTRHTFEHSSREGSVMNFFFIYIFFSIQFNLWLCETGMIFNVQNARTSKSLESVSYLLLL